MNVAAVAEIQPPPIEIDPRPCELCGRTIDQHECFDDGEGPEFFCYPDGDLVQEWELADPRDAWRHTGDSAPPAAVRNGDLPGTPAPIRQRYHTPQSVIDAFWYVVRLDDADYLKRWLAQHPRDVVTLQKLWDGKHARI